MKETNNKVVAGDSIDSSLEKRRISSSFQSQEANDDNGSREKEAQNVKLDSGKGLMLRESMGLRHESGVLEDREVGSVLKRKEVVKMPGCNSSVSKRMSDKDVRRREGREQRDMKEKERVKKRESEVRADVRGVAKKRESLSEFADKDGLVKRRKQNSELGVLGKVRYPESEKDLETVIHRMIERSSDTDRYRDASDNDHINLLSKVNTVKDVKHKDGKHMAGNHDDQSRLKGAEGRKRTSDVEKRSASDGRVEIVTNRGQSDSRYADVSATSIRNRHSPSSSSHATRVQYRYKDMPVNVDEKMLKDSENGNIYVEVSKHKVGSTTEISSGSLFSTIGDSMLQKIMSLYMKLKEVFVMKENHSPTLADDDSKKEALHSFPIEDLELLEIHPDSLEIQCDANNVKPCDEKLDELAVITKNNSGLLSDEKFGGTYTELDVDPSLEEGYQLKEVSSNGECDTRMDNLTWNADQIDTVGTNTHKRLRTPTQRCIDEIPTPTSNPIKKRIKRGVSYVSKSSESSDKIYQVLHSSCDSLVTERQYEGNRVLKSGENCGRRNKISWSMSEVEKLIDGVSLHGVGCWSRIKEGLFASSPHRTRKDLKDKWRNLSNAMYIQTENNRWRPRPRPWRGGKKRYSVRHPLPECIWERLSGFCIV